MDEREKIVYETLEKLGIEYVRFEHERADTMEDCESIGSEVGAVHCKNLFLCNRQQTEFFLLMIRADKKFLTKDVSKQINRARLSFGNEEKLKELLNLYPGSVTCMGLIFDKDKQVKVIIDEDLKKEKMICVHPMVNTASIAVKWSDIESFLAWCGNEIMTVSIPAD